MELWTTPTSQSRMNKVLKPIYFSISSNISVSWNYPPIEIIFLRIHIASIALINLKIRSTLKKHLECHTERPRLCLLKKILVTNSHIRTNCIAPYSGTRFWSLTFYFESTNFSKKYGSNLWEGHWGKLIIAHRRKSTVVQYIYVLRMCHYFA